MTILIAWISVSVGFLMGATWKSLNERQSRRTTNLQDGSYTLHRVQPATRAERVRAAQSARRDRQAS